VTAYVTEFKGSPVRQAWLRSARLNPSGLGSRVGTAVIVDPGMTAPRRPPWILLLALPVWLATALPVSGQTLTADINGDGVSDRIDVGRTAGELLVRLSGAGPAHHFRIPGLAPDGSVAAPGHAGESKLLLTSIGRRYVRLLAWVSATRWRFVSRLPLWPGGSGWRRHARVATPADIPTLDDFAGDATWLVTVPALDLRPLAEHASRLHDHDARFSTLPPNLPRAPRGPPDRQLLP